MPNAVKTDGDADNDLDVDGDDLDVWQLQYGTVPPMVATLAVGEPVESVSLLVSTTEDPLTSYRAAIDAAMALNLFEDGGDAESVPLTESSWVQEEWLQFLCLRMTLFSRGEGARRQLTLDSLTRTMPKNFPKHGLPKNCWSKSSDDGGGGKNSLMHVSGQQATVFRGSGSGV